MENIIIDICIILFLIAMVGALKGFDLRIRKGWLFVLCGCLAGFLFGLINHKDLINSVFLGLILSLPIATTGMSMLRINRKRSAYKKLLDD